VISPDLDLVLPEDLGRLHFVGIGGAGMSGIARVFLEAGRIVTGSDRSDSAHVAELRDLGARIDIGHAAEQVGDADTLVVTGALWQDNPEYQEALRRGLPVLHRANALDWLIRHQKSRLVSVAGAHGKSTSTGMIITALDALGLDPSFVNGADIAGLGRSARLGAGDSFVIEADESDGSFLLYPTAVALITNVDTDHLDHYGSPDAIDDAFVRFAEQASEFVVISSDDPGAQRVAARLSASRVTSFGEAEAAAVRLVRAESTEGGVAFTIRYEGAEYSGRLAVSGAINALNATGAFAVLVGLGVSPEDAVRGLEAFSGTGRRFESHGVAAGVRLYDDYAHHPAEVDAALGTARSVVGAGRVIAVHQPHLYSRTQRLAGEFAEVYEAGADHTVVLDVYGAREDPIPGVTGALVSERFQDRAHVDFVADWQAAAERVAEIARPGDLVMTLSCGDVYRIIPQLRAAIEARASAEAGSPA